jgi:hypothetical protein
VLRKIKLTDEFLSCFFDSPFLEKLEIWDSVGLQKPIILVVEVLIVNCPKLRTLETCMIQDLRVNGVLFQEISYAVHHLTMKRGRNVTVI